MNFKRKAGAAVLAIAAASAIAVPGVAMAANFVSNNTDTAVLTDASKVTVTLVADETEAIDLSDINADATVTIEAAANENESVAITLPAEYTGTYVVNGVGNGEDETDTIVTATSAKCGVITSAVAAPAVEAVEEVTGVEGSEAVYAVSFKADVKAEEDTLNEFLAANDSLISITIEKNTTDLDEIDFDKNVNALMVTVDDSDVTSINGLDNIVGAATVKITAEDLTSLDFGENENIQNLTIDTDLESLSVSGMKALTFLDVTGCDKLNSLDLTDTDDLVTLNINGTELSGLDASDSNSALTITGPVSLDDQYATVSVNDDDDDYNDYVFDLDNIANGMGEYVTVVEGDVTVTNKADDWFDFDEGVLTITSEDAPTAVTYVMGANNKNATYNVEFKVNSEGDRISGADRYDTMVQINTDSDDSDFDGQFPTNEDNGNIVVASGAGYADALSASALAGAYNTGIVTTAVDSLTDDAIDMLDDMENQGTAYIAGGTSAVSYAVEQQLTDLGFNIKRFAGSDRFDTAVKVQDFINDDTSFNKKETVIIASGVNYADALAIAPYSYTQSMPIVLVGADGQMDDDTAALFNKYKKDYEKAIVVGGTAVVSDDVIDTLQGYDMDVIRLAGADRFETNLVINEWLDNEDSSISTGNDIFEAAGYSKDDIDDMNDEGVFAADDANTYHGNNDTEADAYVVTGLGFADALAVAPLAGTHHGVITMVSDADITTVTKAKDEDADTTIIGGTAVISEDLADTIEAL